MLRKFQQTLACNLARNHQRAIVKIMDHSCFIHEISFPPPPHFLCDWDNFLLWNHDMALKNASYLSYYEVGPWKGRAKKEHYKLTKLCEQNE